ncbi:hypothetical protein [Flavicella sediminum]|uniref:hypothetical protein n=1 Tax=Flavicella sediminum TaxID=2585141 RepID=UPI00111CFB2F|nr:hypothetical protein [Flavicella sediminum]
MSGIKTTDITYPNDSIVIVSNLEGIPGGKTLNVAGLVAEEVQAGTPVVFIDPDYKPLSSGVVFEDAADSVKVVKFKKGHYLRVGDEVLSGTITSIDTTDENFDSVTTDVAIGTAVTADQAIVNDGDKAVGVVLGTKTVEDPSVGIMVRGTVNEAALVNPINADVKTALPLIRFYQE